MQALPHQKAPLGLQGTLKPGEFLLHFGIHVPTPAACTHNGSNIFVNIYIWSRSDLIEKLYILEEANTAAMLLACDFWATGLGWFVVFKKLDQVLSFLFKKAALMEQ